MSWQLLLKGKLHTTERLHLRCTIVSIMHTCMHACLLACLLGSGDVAGSHALQHALSVTRPSQRVISLLSRSASCTTMTLHLPPQPCTLGKSHAVHTPSAQDPEAVCCHLRTGTPGQLP